MKSKYSPKYFVLLFILIEALHLFLRLIQPTPLIPEVLFNAKPELRD
jgi:hypothetical protein